MKRRDFLKTAAIAAGSFTAGTSYVKADNIGIKEPFVPVHQITKGPGFHWFGYYDKLQFDPSSRYAVGMKTVFDKRVPAADDIIEIGIIDLEDKNYTWNKIGESKAWSWQQGCMLQWIPGSASDIIWNDRDGDRYVSRIYNTKTSATKTLPKAVYALSPCGKWAVGTEFSRINDLRPGYGYTGIKDPFYDIKAPDEIGIYRLNLETGEHSLIAPLGQFAKFPHNGQDVSDNFHWFNHLLVNTDGTRLTFLNRWRKERMERQKMAATGWTTRMFTLGLDGSEPYIINSSGFISHFVWADATHIAAFVKADEQGWRLWLLEDKTGKLTPIGQEKITADGHNTFIHRTDNRWILNDTYPDKQRYQTLYVYDRKTDRRQNLAGFFEPREFTGEWRVDLHARNSPDGKKIIVDSSHTGERQMHLLDMSGFDYR